MRRAAAMMIVLTLVAAACSDDSPLSTTTEAPPAPSTTLDGTTTTTPHDGTTTTVEIDPDAPTTTLAEITDEFFGRPGDPGLGDPYFPALGNGGYDVEHYLIELSVEPEQNLIAGTTTIEATATQDLASFNLDFRGLEVAAVTVDGADAAYFRVGSEMTVNARLPAGEAFSVAVEYSGNPEAYFPESVGFAMGWIQSDEGSFVASQPAGAMTWYPANDHPSDKAAYTFIITVPEPYTAAASGVLIETTAGEGETTFVWEMVDPMASYLATVVVADLVRVDYEGREDIILRDYLRPALAANPPDSFGLIAEMLAVFEPLFGPYPFDAYGHVVVPNFPAALETQALTVFGDDWFDDSFIEYVVAHELAHQWFGNSVTPASWQDIWLNEGFSTFAEWVWLEHVWGREVMLGQVEETYRELGIVSELAGNPGVSELLGDAVYHRGALTLHALRAEIGDDLLFEILRSWTSRFAYGNATTGDFIALAEEIAERQLDDLFDAWLFQQRLPRLPKL